MKATDLMIGDWVLYGHRFAIIKELYNGHVTILCSINGQNEYVEETYDNIEPITLTPEILERNGFFKSCDHDGIHYKYTLISDGIGFSLKYVRNVFQWLGPLDFKYVHELQHALKLCGIENEIEL
jgi:hypothetical protein